MKEDSDFWDKINYTKEDKEKASFFIEHLGLDYHIYILKYLESMKSGQISYSEIATTIRYDKRIRRILYKYICFFEEYMRAYIVNTYRNDIDKLNKTKYIKQKLNENGNNLFDCIQNLTLGQLIQQINKLKDKEKKVIFSQCKYTKKSIDAIRELRNQVGHNRFLLNNLILKAPRGENSSLRENIKNLYDYLPDKLKTSFKSEIIDAKKMNSKLKEYQTKWDLVPSIIILL